MATGALDANGVWRYGEDDALSPASPLLNLGQASVSDALGTWTAFTPTLGGILLNNGSMIAQYRLAKKGSLFLGIELVLGSTSTFSGPAGTPISFTLPSGFTTVARQQTMNAWINDASTGLDYVASARLLRSATSMLIALNGSLVASYHDSRPFAWAAGDSLQISGMVQVI